MIEKVEKSTKTTKSETKKTTKTETKKSTKAIAKKATTKSSTSSKSLSSKKTLVIVESPAKARTIGKYLGSSYKVVASVGHIRDLPKSKLGIDIDNDFDPQYISVRGKGDLIKELKKEVKTAGKVLLATDPDREGEAISWHLAYLLGVDPSASCRIEFNEVTKDKLKSAIKSPRAINMNLVDAQQARRILDRLVGYQISPLLWRKIRSGLSAGRVQSAALKMICDRETEIKNFVPKEYWNIFVKFLKEKEFTAKLSTYKGKKFEIADKSGADNVLSELKNGDYIVSDVSKKTRNLKPYAPFTTSSLQQDASNKLNFLTRRTMSVAQQLYEGVEVKGRGTIGLVTYIRTDSVRISQEAVSAVKSYISQYYGEKYVGNNFYSNKKKDIQDAHEAIRPTDVTLDPELIKESLSKDQYNLYKLIWVRFVASQMAPAVFENINADIKNGDYIFKATGSKMEFDGFKKLYRYASNEDEDQQLPTLNEGEELQAKDIDSVQKFTQPPPRFTEASLIKELEEKNIGRPSTYAPIVGTLVERKYVIREKRMLTPTQLGFHVVNLMVEYFKDIVDAGFTASMEDKLDDVEMNKIYWKEVIRPFYATLKEELLIADKAMPKIEEVEEETGEICEKCGAPMILKRGRYGEFSACKSYPACKNAKPILKKIGVNCPQCGKDIVARKSKKGKLFYGCSGYPECDQVFWDKPTEKACPTCQERLVEKKTKTSKYACSNRECKYKE